MPSTNRQPCHCNERALIGVATSREERQATRERTAIADSVKSIIASVARGSSGSSLGGFAYNVILRRWFTLESKLNGVGDVMEEGKKEGKVEEGIRRDEDDMDRVNSVLLQSRHVFNII